MLGGGFPAGRISLIYGEAEIGKSALAIQCAVNCARIGYKSIYVDSDGTFSTQRLSQIAHYDCTIISPMIILLKPTTFEDQVTVIDRLENYITGRFGLIIVDTITSLYCEKLGDPRDTFPLNRELNRQIAFLARIAKAHNVATIITSQVRSNLLEEQSSLRPVATRVLKFWSDIVLHLKHTGHKPVIEVFVEKALEGGRGASYKVEITQRGIHAWNH